MKNPLNMVDAGEKNIIESAGLTLMGLCVYRNLLADPVLAAFMELIRAASAPSVNDAGIIIDKYSSFFYILIHSGYGTDFPRYVLDKMLLDENIFTNSAAMRSNTITSALFAAAKNDILWLKSAVSLTPSMFKEAAAKACSENSICKDVINNLPEWDALGSIPHIAANACANNTLAFRSSQICGDELHIFMDKLLLLWNNDVNCGEFMKKLLEYHKENGSGILSRKYAFLWKRGKPDARIYNAFRNHDPAFGSLISSSGYLAPACNPDPVRLSDLIAYESEREEVIMNTEQFLDGFPANNVLLYGDRGTGKSSTVKAILNEYASRGLRMVEVPKLLLPDFPEIAAMLAEKPYKFIIFVDDLSFDDNEESYTSLKAAIDGGLEAKPGNVLIYATSNRRHLIRENFSDRNGLQYGGREDEIRAADTLQEKLSLSDRFGITVVFSSPDKKRYLEIVDKLAEKNGIRMDPETLHKEALKWELWYNGRSPRTARQFINYMINRS